MHEITGINPLTSINNNKKTFYSVNQESLDLKRDIEIAKKTTGIKRECNVDKTVKNIIDVIYSNRKNPFC